MPRKVVLLHVLFWAWTFFFVILSSRFQIVKILNIIIAHASRRERPNIEAFSTLAFNIKLWYISCDTVIWISKAINECVYSFNRNKRIIIFERQCLGAIIVWNIYLFKVVYQRMWFILCWLKWMSNINILSKKFFGFLISLLQSLGCKYPHQFHWIECRRNPSPQSKYSLNSVQKFNHLSLFNWTTRNAIANALPYFNALHCPYLCHIWHMFAL